MRKYSMIMMAFALLLGMTQCKKEITNANNDNTESLSITLKVDNGDKGDRFNLFPSTGAVVFTDGDSIFVGNNGKYVGTLKFSEGLFQGTISGDLSTGDKLHFYFVGNKPTSTAPVAGTTTSCTVDISDQTDYLPVISYAPSTVNYSPSTTFYTAQLLNKSALVKFVPQVATSLPITVLGLNNEVQIDFEHNTLAPSGTTGGITLYSVSDTEKWAILLAQDAVPTAKVTISGYASTVSLPTITNNMYYNSGLTISMTATIPDGAIDGKFTISSNGDQVYFSKGNLQYKYGTGWRFAEHQYDYISTWNTLDWVNHFGWGTWGEGKNPLNTSTYNNDYLWSSDFCGTLTNASSTGWRTMTYTEWSYVFNTREGAASKKGHGNVNGVNGMILLPDDWTLPEGLSFTSGNSSWANVYNVEQWAQMEANGAVFLPAAGYRRYGTSFEYVGSYGNYWSSSYYSSDNAYFVYFYSGDLYPQNNYYRYNGSTVRLVRNVQ